MQAYLSSTAAVAVKVPPPRLSLAEGPGLAHDAGNLLGALSLYCDLLDVPGVLRPEHLHYARELRLLCGRSGDLIHRLLESTRSPIPVSLALPSDPAAVVRSFEPLLRVVAGTEVQLLLSIAQALPDLPFPGEVLERILLNLVRNAALALERQTAGQEHGSAQIHLALCATASLLRLTVTDNGPGMTAAMAADFEQPTPFSAGMVSGLGHRVVHELVKSTGGTLTVQSKSLYGTSIAIEWTLENSVDVAIEDMKTDNLQEVRAGS